MQSTLQQMSTQANDTKLLRGIVVNSGEGKLPSSIYNRIARYQGQTKKNATKIIPINVKELFLVNWQQVEDLQITKSECYSLDARRGQHGQINRYNTIILKNKGL